MPRWIHSLLFSILTLTSFTQQAWQPGEVLLLLHRGANEDVVRVALQDLLPPTLELKGMTALGRESRYYLVQVDGAGVDEPELEKLFSRAAGVEATSLNYKLNFMAEPNDPQYGTQWNMEDSNVEPVWDVTTGGTMANGMRIGVALSDQAIQTDHPDLSGNIWSGSPALGGSADHGTEVASVLGAVGNNSTGIAGVNWDVEIVSSGQTEDLSDAIEQIEFATQLRESFNASNGGNGLLVVSLTASWGFEGGGTCNGLLDPLFTDMADAGILFVTAGPNAAVSIDAGTSYPANCALAEHLVVTSYGPNNETPFAIGPNSVHLLAPGVDIPVATGGGNYTVADGNSFAVPMVAGAIALLYSAPCPAFAQLVMDDPQAARELVKNAILNTTTSFPGGNALTITGGKLNVHAAYQALAGGCAPSCVEHTITLTTTGDPVASWSIINASNTVVLSGQGNAIAHCLDDGCFTIDLMDANNLPMDADYVVQDLNGVVASGTSSGGSFSFSVGNIIPGCTMVGASNFDPLANCNDGSCCTGEMLRVVVAPDDFQTEGTAEMVVTSNGGVLFSGPIDILFDAEFGVPVGGWEGCAPDGCFSVQVSNPSMPLSSEGFVFLNGDLDEPESFSISTGYFAAIGGSVGTEVCDGLDNDCDGEIDEDFIWFVDADNDGWGVTGTGAVMCSPPPSGFSPQEGDCDDDNASRNPDAPDLCSAPDGIDNDCDGNVDEGDMLFLYTDLDGDGFGTDEVLACEQGPGLAPEPGDCDDTNAAIFPNAAETCDGLDNDCDGDVDEDFIMYTDADGDGFGVSGTGIVICAPGPGSAFQDGDCDDTNANIFPGNGCGPCDLSEVTWAADNQALLLDVYFQCVNECGPGDPDCVNTCMQDSGVPIGVVCMACLDTYYSCIITNCSEACTESPEACDLCQDQFGCRQALTSCLGQVDADGDNWWAGSDCDDSDATVNPGAAEVCDGSDNDCDGEVDEEFLWYADADGDGWGGGAGFPSCTDPGPGFVQQAGDCADGDPDVRPNATEICDGIDNNCDGITDGTTIDFQGGCTNPMACNYDPAAVCEDGSCDLGTGGLPVATYATDFTATDVNGDPVDLFSLLAQGKSVVLDFFTTWCPPSIAMNNADLLADWNAHMGPNGLDLIRIVSIEIEDTATVTGSLAPFIAASSWPIIANGSTIAQQYHELGLFNDQVPTLIMICPDRSAQVIYPQPNELPVTDIFDYDAGAAFQLLNEACGCRATACLANIGCMDPNACNYDPSATCPGPCAQAPEWFSDADGDGLGTTSLGTACIQPDNSASTSGDCDDNDPDAQVGLDLYVLSETENDFGSAHYVITQGANVIEGDIQLPEETQGVGMLSFCIGQGCFGVQITPNDVPLWEEATITPAGDTENLTTFFNIAEGFYGSLMGPTPEVCDGVDNDCDGEIDEDFVCGPPEPCTDYILELQSGATAPGAVTYEVLDETGNNILLSGNNPIPANSIGTVSLCLPDGCYRLRVTDNAGDGLLGYILREAGANGRRLIDNAFNMSDGVSQIANGGTFCLPLGTVSPIWSSCDKLDWVNNKFIVCHADVAVTAQYGVTNTTSGYEFWFYDPNGSYSYRRFRSHATSDGYGSGATRACHFKVNGWVNNMANPHIPANILLNVRVRGRVANVNQDFGPACQFKIDPALAACPRVWLQDDPANTEDYSCGVSREFGGASRPANRIYAKPPQPVPVVASSLVRYQFRFRITGEGICIVRPPQTSARMVLNWTTGTPLECSKTYEVDVRVSLDGGATWCFGPGSSSQTAACADAEDWGRVCLVTINPCLEAMGAGSSMARQGDGTFTLYPNPNRGDQLFVSLSSVAAGVNAVNVDVYDLTGKRVMARTIAVQDGFVKTNLDLNGDLAGGMYLVNITAGDKTYTDRLVIQP